MNQSRSVVKTLLVGVALLVTGPVLGAECDDVLDIGRWEVRFHVPSSYDPSVPTPLVLALHGFSVTPDRLEAFLRLTPLSDRYGFLYALPEGSRTPVGALAWNGGCLCCTDSPTEPDDAGYLKRLIDTIKSRCNVDPRRVYVVGHSDGGFMSYRMACDYAASVSAIASLAGATFYWERDCQPQAPVHVLEIHGTSDEFIPYEGGHFWCGTPYPGAVQTVEKWASYNGCLEPPEEIPAAMDFDSFVAGTETGILRYRYGCDPGGSAELWTIEGAKHYPRLTSEARTHIVEHLLDCLGCSGSERLAKIRCNAKGKLVAKLMTGLSGDSYRLELSSGVVKEGWLNRKGRAKVKLANQRSGEGMAVASWGCGATAEQTYRCP